MALRERAEEALSKAEFFIDIVGFDGWVKEIYLIGSRAETMARPDSDYDFLIVGPGLNELENVRERIFKGDATILELEAAEEIGSKPRGVDLVFSSSGPRPRQRAIKVYDSGRWLLNGSAGPTNLQRRPVRVRPYRRRR